MPTTSVVQRRLADYCAPHNDVNVPRILCVDDDPEVTWAIERRLQQYVVLVDRAYHGMHGFWEAIRHHPDLIIMDLAMPNGDGKYIIECLRRNRDTAGTPVIILTGMRDPALQGQLLAAGADMFLRKPIAFDDLVHNIGRYIVLKPRSEIIESSE